MYFLNKLNYGIKNLNSESYVDKFWKIPRCPLQYFPEYIPPPPPPPPPLEQCPNMSRFVLCIAFLRNFTKEPFSGERSLKQKYFKAKPGKKGFQRSITSWNYFVKSFPSTRKYVWRFSKLWKTIVQIYVANFWGILSEEGIQKREGKKKIQTIAYTMFAKIFIFQNTVSLVFCIHSS